MVRRSVEGDPVAPFLMKCYEMVDDPTTDGIIGWSDTGDSFQIIDKTDFERVILPSYFKHNNFASFMRQLNIYECVWIFEMGFRKIDTDRWIFANDCFIKDKKNLLKNICRRKQSQIVVQQTTSEQKEDKVIRSCQEQKTISGLWGEVECLKADRNSLMQELVKVRQHQQNSHSKLVVLRERIRDMEKDQQQMLSFIVMAMQNPGYLVHFLQPKETKWRRAEAGKSVLKRVIIDDPEQDLPSTEGMIVKYEGPVNQTSLQSNSEILLESSLSNDELNSFFEDMDFISEPMDEELPVLDAHGPMVIPDLPDDYSFMEQYLFTSPLSENKEDGDFDIAGWETDSALGTTQNSIMEMQAFDSEPERDENLETLTEKMGHLASECNIKHQNNF